MIRLEIIANNTVEEDIIEAMEHIDKGFYYSKINSVHGRGKSDPRWGDAVWPEENFIFIVFCEDDKALEFVKAINKVKERFDREGIKVFAIPFQSPIEI